MNDSDITSPPHFSSDSIISKYGLSDKIYRYLREILLYNEKINIVSRETSPDDLKSIAADSLVPFEFIPTPTGHLFDIGPGAGFPAIVVLMAFPDLRGLLIERTQKKIEFLRNMLDMFGLDADIIHADFAEAISRIDPASFDTGLMKLVRPDSKMIRHVLDILKPAGWFVYYSDLDERSVKILSDFKINKYKYFLDKSNRARTITVLTKTG